MTQNPQTPDLTITLQLYLDNGSAGDAVTSNFQTTKTAAKITDMRTNYPAHDDLNAWWMDQKT